MSSQEEIVQIQVKFEYFTEKNEQKFSEPFEAKVNLNPEKFEINCSNIINLCDFRKKEDRLGYYMLDLDKNQFIINTDELIEVIKLKKLLIMRNCQYYAKHIIGRLREEEERYKLKKNTNLNNDKDNVNKSNDVKGSDSNSSLKFEIIQFKKNLNFDIFAEEFISYEGIKYLVSFVKYSIGEIRKMTLEVLNYLLDFQSTNDYININNEIIVTLYEILMKGDDIKSNIYALNILMIIISQDQSKAKYLLDIAEEYAKKSVTKMYSKIVSFFRNNSLELKTKALILINILLNFGDSERFLILKKQLKEAGIYEELEKISYIKDKEFQEQLTNFQIKTDKIIKNSEYELQFYNRQREEMERKCEEIEVKYEGNIQSQIMYQRIIEELIQIKEMMKTTKGDSLGYLEHKDSKTQFEQIESESNVPSVENELFDFVSILKINQNDENKQEVDLLEKYYKLRKGCKRLIEENKKLEIKKKELIEEKIKSLKNILENIKLNKEKLAKETKELESRFKELSKKLKGLKTNISTCLQLNQSSASNPSESSLSSFTPTSKENIQPSSESSQFGIQPSPNILSHPGVNLPPNAPQQSSIPLAPEIPFPLGVPTPPEAPPFIKAPVVPQPTKPKLKLKVKLKNIQWAKILLLPKSHPQRQDLVWDSIKVPEIDIDEIVSLFSDKNKEQTSELEKNQNIITKTFLNPKRAKEVGVSGAKLPSIDVISKALITMDNNILSEHNIDALLLIAITKEELEEYKNMIKDEGILEKNARFLIELNEVPNYKEKLKIWSTILKYDFMLPKLQESFNFMILACKELKENKHFKSMLSIILSLGNIMNAGTEKGQADGFSLDLLPKLAGIKDNSGNSLLNFVASKTNQEDPTFEGFKNKFLYLKKASGYSLKETKKKLEEIKNMVINIENELKNLNTRDEFYTIANNSLLSAQKKVDELKNKYEENTKIYHETVKFFGYKEKDDYYNENGLFFKMLLQFFKEVDNNMPKLDVKKIIYYQKLNMGKKVNKVALIQNLIKKLKNKIQC